MAKIIHIYGLIAVVLLQMQTSYCDLVCEYATTRLDTAECFSVGGKINRIALEDQTFYRNLATTTLDVLTKKFDWENLQGLILKNAGLLSIDKTLFANTKKMKYVDLSGNDFLDFETFTNSSNLLKTVEVLKLSGCNVVYFLNSLSGWLSLRHLELSNIRPEGFDMNDNLPLAALNTLFHLEILDLSRNGRIDLSEFHLGSKLKFLNISQTSPLLSKNCFKTATSLTRIILSHSGLRAIPENTFLGSNIKYIDLSYNSLTDDSLDSFSITLSEGMTHLNLSHNNIQDLSKSYYNHMESWEVLDISYNGLKHVHSNAFGGAAELNYLDLSHNKLNRLNFKTFSKALKLRHIDLSYNLISELSGPIFSKLLNLDTVNLNGNFLKTLHANLFQFNTNLRIILLGNNQLKSLDIHTFSHLNETTTLDLRSNKLTSLPDDLLHLGRLKDFIVSCNRLTYLPLHFFEADAAWNDWIVYLHGNPWKCVCLDQVIGSLQNYQFNQSYFNSEQYPTCYIGDSRKKECDNEPLSEEDFVSWEKSVKDSGVVC